MKLSTIFLGLISLGLMAFAVLDGGPSRQIPAPLNRDQATATPTPVSTPVGNPHNNGDCLACHSNSGMTVKFANGEKAAISFDSHQAVHNNYACVVCHDAERTYPHQNSVNTACQMCHWQLAGKTSAPTDVVFDSTYQDQRAMVLGVNQSCGKCHSDQFQTVKDSAHARVMADGNRYAPVCVDCHGSHDIIQVKGSRTVIPQICSKCHMAEFTDYRSSVHGSALEEQSNPDVPTCGDCHGIHKVIGPNEASFRSDSITVCGKCHSNEAVMSKYGISTAVLNTYLDDFHGRTVDFFRKSGETQVPTATCYDCHGVHNIRKPDDPLSKVYPANLQKTCSQCHTDANIRFPQAWLDHYAPTWQDTPALYAVNQIYKSFVPMVIGGFVIYIGVDARRRLADWFKKRHSQ